MRGQPVAERFGQNLRRCRRRIDLTQAELGALLGLHRSGICALERGLRMPRLDTIVKLSAGARASPCVLLAGMSWQPGHYVEGTFYVEDDASWAVGRKTEIAK